MLVGPHRDWKKLSRFPGVGLVVDSEPLNMGARNQTLVLWKSNKRS